MSTIYSDAAGNKYLGDCRWGNHDINYPTAEFLKSIDERTIIETFLSDMGSIFTAGAWENVFVDTNWTVANYSAKRVFSANPPGSTTEMVFSTYQSISPPRVDYVGITGGPSLGTGWTSNYSVRNYNFDYVASLGNRSLAIKTFTYNSNYTAVAHREQPFFYWGLLEDVNQNFGYYSDSEINHAVVLLAYSSSNSLALFSASGAHYIVDAQKTLLTTDRAAYTISCSDGQTPGSQWATDMWVYDNNADLGYPVIGRVPNMLLGVGTYTYLKPVRIIGSATPDAGSPWYLPVGTYAGKTLLMRCYSSV